MEGVSVLSFFFFSFQEILLNTCFLLLTIVVSYIGCQYLKFKSEIL